MNKKISILEQRKFDALKNACSKDTSVIQDVFFFCATFGQDNDSKYGKIAFSLILTASFILGFTGESILVTLSVYYFLFLIVLFFAYQVKLAVKNYQINCSYSALRLSDKEEKELQNFFSRNQAVKVQEIKGYLIDYLRKTQTKVNEKQKKEPI